MPDREKLKLVLGRAGQDLSKVRIPGLSKPFEELTISELTQLRPSGNLEDTYEVNAVTDNVSVTTSALLHELGKTRALADMKREVLTHRLQEISSGRSADANAPRSGDYVDRPRGFWDDPAE